MQIAVVGSGISGLSAAWLLARDHHVTLFEANDYLGGHTHTVEVSLDGASAPVDTGFLVFNERTYPNLVSLFRVLDIDSVASEMSFSVRLSRPDLEWGGSNLATLFGQRRNLARPAFWSMLRDILRFNRDADRLLLLTADRRQSLGELLAAEGYGRPFRDWYLLPMAAAIWSCPTGAMLDFPAHGFLSFCRNHGLLQINDRPQWRTVRGGGREYVARMAAAIQEVRTAAPVLGVRRDGRGVELKLAEGWRRFDACVLACHTDQALRLLRDPSEAERQVLGGIGYQPNRVVLHSDPSFLPRRRGLWSAWNYQAGEGGPDGRPVAVSYLINRLQPLPFQRPVIVTLNPFEEPDPARTIARFDYDHPLLDRRAFDARRWLEAIQGSRHTWFCGAWAGYGFHEDGLKAGLAVAARIGATVPWRPVLEAAA